MGYIFMVALIYLGVNIALKYFRDRPNLKNRTINSAFRLIFPVVLVTKFRRKSLTNESLKRMEHLLRELLNGNAN